MGFRKGYDPNRHILTPEDRHKAFVATARKWTERTGDGTPHPPEGNGARMMYKALLRWKQKQA